MSEEIEQYRTPPVGAQQAEIRIDRVFDGELIAQAVQFCHPEMVRSLRIAAEATPGRIVVFDVRYFDSDGRRVRVHDVG